MSFLQATFAVHAFYQKLPTTPLPYKVDTTLNKLQSNRNYTRSISTLSRKLVAFVMSSAAVGCLAYVAWLVVHWEDYTQKHLEQALIYLIALCAIGIYGSFFYTQEVYGEDLMYPQNQFLTLQPDKTKSTPAKDMAKFSFVYGLTGATALGWFALFFGPFFVPYCPIQLIFGTSLAPKLTASVIYSSLYIFCIPTVLSLGLFTLVFLEWAIVYSNELYGGKSEKTDDSNQIRFRRSYKKFQMFRMVANIHSSIVEFMFTALIIIGIFMISCAGYCTIEMTNRLPLFLYITFPVLFVIGLLIATVFTHLGGIPCENVVEFIVYWKRILRNRKDRMIIRSTPLIGFRLGPYGIGTKTLGILICEDILNNVVNLLVM